MNQMVNNTQSSQRDNEVLTILSTELLEKDNSPVVLIKRQWNQILKNLLVLLSPGDNQYKDLPKRFRLMLVSFVIPFIFFLIKVWRIPTYLEVRIYELMVENIPNMTLPATALVTVFRILTMILLAFLTYKGMYWGFKGLVRKEAKRSILPFGAVYTAISVMFLIELFSGNLNRVYLWLLFVVATAIFMLSLYILSLAINVLNVHLFYAIPLSRLAESIIYIFAVIMVFLLTFTVDLIALPALVVGNIYAVIGLFILFVFLLSFIIMFLLRYFLPNNKDLTLLIIGSVLLLTATNIGLFFVLPTFWLTALATATLAYVNLGYMIHRQQNSMNKSVLIEYSVVIFTLFLYLITR